SSVFPAPCSLLLALCTLSLDHFVRPVQHGLRNRKPDLLCRLEIDHKLELRRLLDWKFSRLGALEDLVHVRGSAAKQIGNVRAVGREPPGFDPFYRVEYRWQPVLYCELCNLCSMRIKDA